jgi:hypothetical protein
LVEEAARVTWIEVALLICALVGITAGAFLVAQRPAFWVGLGMAAMKAAWPYLLRYFGKRMSPEEEAEYQREFRAGRGDQWLRRRRGQPPKG